MRLLFEEAHELLVDFLEVGFLTERHDDKREEEFARAQENLRVRVLNVYPKGLKPAVGVVDVVTGDAALGDLDTNLSRLAVDKEREREACDDNEDAEDDIAEDDRGDRHRDGDDTHGPEPIRATLFVLVLVSRPGEGEG